MAYILLKNNIPIEVEFKNEKQVNSYISNYKEAGSIEWFDEWTYKLRTSNCIFVIKKK